MNDLAVQKMLRPSPRRLRRLVPFHQAAWGIALLVAVLAGWICAYAWNIRAGIGFLTLAGFTAAISGLAKPFVGLLGIGILCTLDPLSRNFLLTGGLLRYNALNYWLLIVMAIFLAQLWAARLLPLLLVQALSGLMTAQLMMSTDIETGTQHVMDLFSFCGLWVYFFRVRQDEDSLLWLALICGATAAGGAAVLMIAGGFRESINANAYAYLPLTGLFAACFTRTALEFANWKSISVACLALLNSGWVYLSGSRGAMIVAVVCWLFLGRNLRGWVSRITLVLLAAAAVGAGLLLFRQDMEYSSNRVGVALSSEDSLMRRTSGRSEIAKAGWAVFLSQPWGIGTGSFALSYAKISSQLNLGFSTGRQRAAHSEWIRVLAENGLIGLLLLLAFVSSFACIGWQRRKTGVFYLGCFATATLAAGLVSAGFQSKGLNFMAAGVTSLLYTRTSKVLRNRSKQAHRDMPPAYRSVHAKRIVVQKYKRVGGCVLDARD